MDFVGEWFQETKMPKILPLARRTALPLLLLASPDVVNLAHDFGCGVRVQSRGSAMLAGSIAHYKKQAE